MKPTDTLIREHEIILHVLDALEREAARARETGKLDTPKLKGIIEFLRNFADGCHHAKEEKLLFPAMIGQGMPADAGPIPVMLADHEKGREHIRAMAAAVERGDDPAAADHMDAYAALLRSHIHKENKFLFPMADQVLSGEDQADLVEGFEQVEREMGEGTHEKWHAFAHGLG